MAAAGFAVVVLAAGLGTRMRSRTAKMLHQAAGRPVVEHVLRALTPLDPDLVVVVVGHGEQEVRQLLAPYQVTFVRQRQQLGTGHALLEAKRVLAGFEGSVLTLNGDGPLLRSETLRALRDTHEREAAGMTLITCSVSDPAGLGRIVRDGRGDIERIVEEKDATCEEREIHEVNPGIYLFDRDVFTLAQRLTNDNTAGEYYVTDLPGIYLQLGRKVASLSVADESEVLGVNDRRQLALADRILRDRIRDHWMLAGVTMIAPEQVFIDDTVTLGSDVTLYPGVWLTGATQIGSGATVGPFSVLHDCVVKDGASVEPFKVLEGVELA